MKNIIFNDLKKAMKNKDVVVKGLLQIVKSNLDSAEKEKGCELTELESQQVIYREIKQIKQSIEGAKKANRQDFIDNEQFKLSFLEGYLPKQMTETEVYEKLTSLGIKKGDGMGEAIKVAKQHLSGKTDNSTIAKVIKGIVTGGLK